MSDRQSRECAQRVRRKKIRNSERENQANGRPKGDNALVVPVRPDTASVTR
jgi:hypothetical protein